MTDSSYYLAWLIYIVASTGICIIGWRLIKPWTSLSFYSFLVPLLILLLTPYFSDPGLSRLAPAILTVLFEGVFGNTEIALKAAGAISALLVPGILVSFILHNKGKIARQEGL